MSTCVFELLKIAVVFYCAICETGSINTLFVELFSVCMRHKYSQDCTKGNQASKQYAAKKNPTSFHFSSVISNQISSGIKVLCQLPSTRFTFIINVHVLYKLWPSAQQSKKNFFTSSSEVLLLSLSNHLLLPPCLSSLKPLPHRIQFIFNTSPPLHSTQNCLYWSPKSSVGSELEAARLWKYGPWEIDLAKEVSTMLPTQFWEPSLFV